MINWEGFQLILSKLSPKMQFLKGHLTFLSTELQHNTKSTPTHHFSPLTGPAGPSPSLGRSGPAPPCPVLLWAGCALLLQHFGSQLKCQFHLRGHVLI